MSSTKPQWIISLKREKFKFSAAHMTIFPDGTKERLHGHNYCVSLKIHLNSANFENSVNFSVFKEMIIEICESLDERVLVAENNKFSSITSSLNQVNVSVLSSEYSFPKEDVLVLPIDNISVEQLSSYVAKLFMSKINSKSHLSKVISAIEVEVEESVGQSAIFFLANNL